MRVYEFKREKRIEEIANLIKNMQINAEPINKKEIITAITVRHNVSRKTAGDYYLAATFKNEKSG